MAIGYDISVWGREIPSLKPVVCSLWPIAITFCAAVPSTWICLLNRRPLVHLWLYVAPAYQLYVGINYVLQGGYFGCDRNGCSAEENFVVGNIVALIVSLVGAGLIQFVLILCDSFFAWQNDGPNRQTM